MQQSHLARQQIHWLLGEPKIRYRVKKKKAATEPYPGPDEFSSNKIYSFEVQIDIIVCSKVFHWACSLYFFRRNLVCVSYLSLRVVCL